MRLSTAIICSLLLTLPGISVADIIYFKDGMKTVCQGRVRTEDNEVKCNYKGVVLSYRRADVENIYQTVPDGETDEPPDPGPAPAENGSEGMGELAATPDPPGGGPAFYDPRRPYKYWSSPSSRHHTYREAVEALAREFDRPPDWVEERIGGSNDLQLIRRKMSRAAEPLVADDPPPPAPAPASAGSFYNPRREYKYQISATGRYRTYREAIEALAEEYGSSPQWVEENMGNSNDISVIRDNLGRNNRGTSRQ